MSVHRENPGKIYVKVRADHLLDGRILPLLLRTEDGPPQRIDVRQAPSLKAGGQGTRYTCQISERIIQLFYDDPYWFIEAD